MKTLVAGWFSFSNGHATAGDLLTRDLTCQWLQRAGHTVDVAVDAPFIGGVDWRSVDPDDYSIVVFVCGPFEKGELETEFLARFNRCRLIGLNLSMQIPLHMWNPFDLLIERDSSVRTHSDMVFGTCQPKVPVVGVCLVEAYDGALVESANAAIQRLIDSAEMAVVPIDTRLDTNSTGLRSPAEIESLIARVDVLVTTRLHGTVLALKNGIPVLAIDPEAGGAKIQQQAETIRWPVFFTVDKVTDEGLQEALAYCLTDDARALARQCGESAAKMVESMGDDLVAALVNSDELDARYRTRMVILQEQANAALAAINLTDETEEIMLRHKLYRVGKRVLRLMTPKAEKIES